MTDNGLHENNNIKLVPSHLNLLREPCPWPNHVAPISLCKTTTNDRNDSPNISLSPRGKRENRTETVNFVAKNETFFIKFPQFSSSSDRNSITMYRSAARVASKRIFIHKTNADGGGNYRFESLSCQIKECLSNFNYFYFVTTYTPHPPPCPCLSLALYN